MSDEYKALSKEWPFDELNELRARVKELEAKLAATESKRDRETRGTNNPKVRELVDGLVILNGYSGVRICAFDNVVVVAIDGRESGEDFDRLNRLRWRRIGRPTGDWAYEI